MQELEKILEEMREASVFAKNYDGSVAECVTIGAAERILRKHTKNDGWIPVEKGLPECEQEVFILTERGTETTALYEDGKILESKSKWYWNDIEGEWDDEEDCMIIPEGWWEYRHFNPDDVYNNVVDEKVIAWHPLPEHYKPEKEDKQKVIGTDFFHKRFMEVK